MKDLFGKYKIAYHECDTVSGAYSLDRLWVETEPFPCAVEYNGVFPVNWKVEDVFKLYKLEKDGKVCILVHVEGEDGSLQLNH